MELRTIIRVYNFTLNLLFVMENVTSFSNGKRHLQQWFHITPPHHTPAFYSPKILPGSPEVEQGEYLYSVKVFSI